MQTYRLVLGSGSERWIEVNGLVLFDDEGARRTPVRFVGTVRDVSERFVAQRALRESNKRLRVALDAADLGAWSMVPPMEALSIDERGREMFGLEDSSATALDDFVSRIHPADRDTVRQAIARTLDPDEPNDGYATVYRVHSPPDSPSPERWVNARGQTLFERDGAGRRASRFTGVLRDVTDQRGRDLMLEESEERLRIALESASLGMWVMEPGMDRLIVDQRGRVLFGLEEYEGVDLAPYLDRMHPADRPGVAEAIKQSLRSDGPEVYDIEYRVHPSPGVVRWLSAQGRTVFEDRDGARTAVRFTGVLRDITEQKNTGHALRESEGRLRTIFERIDEGYGLCEIVVKDGKPVDYRFIEVNPLFETMTGMRDAPGKTALELVPSLESRWIETYGESPSKESRYGSRSKSSRWADGSIYSRRLLSRVDASPSSFATRPSGTVPKQRSSSARPNCGRSTRRSKPASPTGPGSWSSATAICKTSPMLPATTSKSRCARSASSRV